MNDDKTDLSLYRRAVGMVSKSAGEVEEAQEDDQRVPIFGSAATVAHSTTLWTDEL